MPPLFPLIVTLLIGGTLSWLWLTDNVARSAGLAILTLLWFILIGFWWALRRRGCRLKRLGILAVSVAILVAAFRFGVRYEGSADGSAFPRLTFRWTKNALPVLPALRDGTAEPSGTESPMPGVADMPRFLGEKGDGILPPPSFHTDWAAHRPRRVWSIPVGLGWSGFAVAGHRAITQEQRGEMECITCYHLGTGALLWSHVDTARFSEMLGGDGPRATPTLDVAAGQVFALGATGLLNCLDLATGTRKWQRNVCADADAPKNLEWGKSASPLLTGEWVVASGGDRGTSLIAYRRSDGQPVWKAGTDGGSYSSPVVMTLAGREQIVSVNRESVTGHDPATGATLWTFAWPGTFPKVCQPAAAGPDQLLITSSYGVKSHLLQVTAGADGHSLDATSIWDSSRLRTKFSSASVIGAHAYAIDEGTLCCIDLKDGERIWRDGRYGFGQHVRLGESLLLIQAEQGHAVLVQASPEKLIELARLDALSSKTWNPPTLAGRYLLLRNDREAICFELPAR